jgi:hypothetical protein
MQEDIGIFKRFLIRHGGFIYHCLLVCFTLAGFWGLSESQLIIKGNKHGECTLSDWQSISSYNLDFATNIVCYKHYSGKGAKYTRQNEYNEFIARINRGDTLIVGADYYALTGISEYYFRGLISPRIYNLLQEGNIVVWKFWEGYAQIISINGKRL